MKTRSKKTQEQAQESMAEQSPASGGATAEPHNGGISRRRLEMDILEISEREKHRLGCDLHNDLVQRLVGISYLGQLLANALKASDAPEAQQAAKISAELAAALKATHALTRGLYPAVIEERGLMEALADLAALSSEIYRVDCRFIAPVAELALSHHVATHCYRIAQEAITNAVYHGNAQVIQVEMKVTHDGVSLVISDNGTGLPEPMPAHHGMGLRMMHYRADIIGASLVIASPHAGGVTITCRIPST